MTLRFIGVDPNTPNDGSPTVWLDEDRLPDALRALGMVV
jgi:hypothetical protein